jgi:outer membrane protein
MIGALISTLLLLGSVPGPPAGGELKVRIEGVEHPAAGPITVLLFSSAEGFPVEGEKAAYREVVRPTASSANLTVAVAAGTYAVSLFQDLNGNRECDRNFIGMPREPIGAANQHRLGRPSFRRSSVNVAAGGVTEVRIPLLNQ